MATKPGKVININIRIQKDTVRSSNKIGGESIV